MGIFLEGEDSRGDHGLGRLVQFRFKAPPGTASSSITTHTPSGQRNCASWASQPQKSVTLLPCPGGRTTKSTNDMWWHWTQKKNTSNRAYYIVIPESSKSLQFILNRRNKLSPCFTPLLFFALFFFNLSCQYNLFLIYAFSFSV